MDLIEWIEYGKSQGWCSEVTCSSHAGVPYTPEEDALWDEGSDPCAFVMRLWEDSL